MYDVQLTESLFAAEVVDSVWEITIGGLLREVTADHFVSRLTMLSSVSLSIVKMKQYLYSVYEKKSIFFSWTSRRRENL